MTTAQPVATRDPGAGAGVTRRRTARGPGEGQARCPRCRRSPSPSSTGRDRWRPSRGGEHVVDPADGDPLTGEVDALGSPWSAACGRRRAAGTRVDPGCLERPRRGPAPSGTSAAPGGPVDRQLPGTVRPGPTTAGRPTTSGPQLARQQLEGPQVTPGVLGRPQLARPGLRDGRGATGGCRRKLGVAVGGRNGAGGRGHLEDYEVHSVITY